MNDRSLSRYAITFFALRAILTQAATLAISDFGLRIERRPSILHFRWKWRSRRNEIISSQPHSIRNPKSTNRNRADFRRDAGGFVAEVDFARHG
jgi:hypothetical protein